METYIHWDIEEDEKQLEVLPELSFECPKMNVNDFMSFDIQTSYRHHILMPVKVSHVSIDIEWKKSKENPKSIKTKDATQWLYVTPNVLNASSSYVQYPVEQRGRRHRFPS